MEEELSLKEIQKEWHGSYKSYYIGFVISLLLTAASFFLGFTRPWKGYGLILTIVALGILQAIAQLKFLLHLGQEPKPRWETLIFYFMLMVLFIIALGSIWIMYDLNQRVMTNMEGMTN
jgi:cytochrome o ubiquinol oxidase subunit IV